MDSGDADGMVSPLAALSTRMKRCAAGGRWPHIRISLSAS